MRTPSVRLTSWLVVLGWVLVIGGAIELIDLFYHAWPHSWWHEHTLLHGIVRGPATHIGLGLALWALARR